MTSGTMTTDGNYPTYYNNGGTATLKGGTIIQSQKNRSLVYNLVGTTNIDGINLANKSVAIQNGDSNNTTAILNVNSGIISSEENLAISNYATVNHSDGTVSSNATASVTVANRTTGSYTLNGGMITGKTNVFNNLGTFVMTSGTMTTDGNYPTYYNNGGTATFQGGNILNTGGATLTYNLSGTVNMDGMSLTNTGGVLINGKTADDTNVMNLNNCSISSTESTTIGNNGILTITNGSVASTAGNAINNSRKVTLKGNAKITSSIKNYPTIYNKSGATLTKDSTVTVTNTGGGTAIYNAS